MTLTFTKKTVTRTNPFDGSQETVIEVNNVRIDDEVIQGEHYTFENGTSEGEIYSVIHDDLVAKGYSPDEE
jgi:hypothetical protein